MPETATGGGMPPPADGTQDMRWTLDIHDMAQTFLSAQGNASTQNRNIPSLPDIFGESAVLGGAPRPAVPWEP